jgi:hypothetical protein
MGEHIGQHKKATDASFSIPTLKQPTRGFGVNSPDASSQATTEVQLKKTLGHDISRMSLRPQTKLTVNQPGDVYEQETDKVAQQVMQRVSEPAGNQQSIQREELPEEEEELQMKSLAGSNISLQREELPEEEEELQMKSLAGSNISLQREELPEEEEELQMKSLAGSNISLQREELPEEEEELQMKSLAGSNISLQREELPEEEEELQMKSLSASPQAGIGMQPLNKPLTHDISRMSLRLQTRLTVNQPGDVYEQEADRVAGQVMQRMSQPGTRQSIQREAFPEEEDKLQMKSLADSITPVVQRKGRGGIAATSELETSIQQARQGGQPLSDDIRQPMEQAFGTDFSSVKIHTDSQSDQLNQSVQARAFTTGQDIFFRQGEYAPQSNGGKELLAHELTHVVQQNGGAVQPKTLSNETAKKNKIQTKSLLSSPADFQPAIQRRENPQQKTEQDKQRREQVGLTDTEKPQQQRQDSANKDVAIASPPATGAGAAAGSSENPPPANQNNKNPQKQTHTEQPAEPKAKQANPEQGEMQGQVAAGKAGVGTAPSAGKGLASAEADGEKAPASANDDPSLPSSSRYN